MKLIFKILSVTVLALGCFVAVLYGKDRGQRFVNWRSLNEETVRSSAREYAWRNNLQLGDMCFYEVSCDEEGAFLVLVPDLTVWDAEAVKDLIWQRRFNASFCSGQTANLAIASVPVITGVSQSERTERAVWSFYSNAFHPTLSRFSSASFSAREVEVCTRERSAFQ